jgi:prepilin-type N-terminal cleavage/methylation domain-containing protein
MSSQSEQMRSSQGFTLIEVMIVVGILGVLVSLATVSYGHFMTKAKAVEGELIVHEIERLQSLHRSIHHSYTDNFADLGFSMAGTFKYYLPELRVGADSTGINYQVRAVPTNVSSSNAWLLTSFRDGSLRVDRMPASDVGVFASARYAGMSSPTLTSSEAANFYSGINGGMNLEPEWSDGSGSSSHCQECGRVVVHQRSNTGGGLK